MPDCLRDPAVESERFSAGLENASLCRGHWRHERIRGVTVSRNRAIQIDIHLRTYLRILEQWRYVHVSDRMAISEREKNPKNSATFSKTLTPTGGARLPGACP